MTIKYTKKYTKTYEVFITVISIKLRIQYITHCYY